MVFLRRDGRGALSRSHPRKGRKVLEPEGGDVWIAARLGGLWAIGNRSGWCMQVSHLWFLLLIKKPQEPLANCQQPLGPQHTNWLAPLSKKQPKKQDTSSIALPIICSLLRALKPSLSSIPIIILSLIRLEYAFTSYKLFWEWGRKGEKTSN